MTTTLFAGCLWLAGLGDITVIGQPKIVPEAKRMCVVCKAEAMWLGTGKRVIWRERTRWTLVGECKQEGNTTKNWRCTAGNLHTTSVDGRRWHWYDIPGREHFREYTIWICTADHLTAIPISPPDKRVVPAINRGQP